MMAGAASFGLRTATATLQREFLSYRINRFLYLHLALMLAIGLLALFAPPEAAGAGAAWWVVNGVMYLGSLSALLFGLSSAQAEADEYPMLFTHPIRLAAWVGGKCAGLLLVVAGATVLLLMPSTLASGLSRVVVVMTLAAAGISVLFAWLGLAIGFWIHDPVRGLIAAFAGWCVLLFGVDLVLIAIAGASWVHDHPGSWVAALMLSPLDTYRIMLLFAVERAAFSGAELDPLTRWWIDHAGAWFALCVTGWSLLVAAVATVGAHRRRVAS